MTVVRGLANTLRHALRVNDELLSAVMALRRVTTLTLVPLVCVNGRVTLETLIGETSDCVVTLHTHDNLDGVVLTANLDWCEIGVLLLDASALRTDTVTLAEVKVALDESDLLVDDLVNDGKRNVLVVRLLDDVACKFHLHTFLVVMYPS